MKSVSTIAPVSPSLIRLRRQVVIVLYLLAAIWGVVNQFAAENFRVQALGTLAFATLGTLWFVIDRRILGYPRIFILETLFFVVWPFAALIHLVATRRLYGFGLWLLHGFGLIAVSILMAFISVLVLMMFGIMEPPVD